MNGRHEIVETSSAVETSSSAVETNSYDALRRAVSLLASNSQDGKAVLEAFKVFGRCPITVSDWAAFVELCQFDNDQQDVGLHAEISGNILETISFQNISAGYSIRIRFNRHNLTELEIVGDAGTFGFSDTEETNSTAATAVVYPYDEKPTIQLFNVTIEQAVAFAKEYPSAYTVNYGYSVATEVFTMDASNSHPSELETNVTNVCNKLGIHIIIEY